MELGFNEIMYLILGALVVFFIVSSIFGTNWGAMVKGWLPKFSNTVSDDLGSQKYSEISGSDVEIPGMWIYINGKQYPIIIASNSSSSGKSIIYYADRINLGAYNIYASSWDRECSSDSAIYFKKSSPNILLQIKCKGNTYTVGTILPDGFIYFMFIKDSYYNSETFFYSATQAGFPQKDYVILPAGKEPLVYTLVSEEGISNVKTNIKMDSYSSLFNRLN